MGEFEIKAVRTYATVENVRKAVARIGATEVQHFIMTQIDPMTGKVRYFPVFCGPDSLKKGIHFHFNVVG